MDAAIERWKQYLRRDPTRWLLETDDPSLLLWYQLDIAHRPEEAPAVREARERVLYSDPVQAILARQDEAGYWGDAASPARPYYSATVWNLALLAELGLPRTSRRARLAAQFLLQNFWHADGHWTGLNAVESGYLVGALAYFGLAEDPQVVTAARALNPPDLASRAAALRAWSAFADEGLAERIADTLGSVLDEWDKQELAPVTWPPFDPTDPVVILDALARFDKAGDARAARLVEAVMARQDKAARWTLEKDLNELLLTPFERQGEPSRWATLNALRAIVRMVTL